MLFTFTSLSNMKILFLIKITSPEIVIFQLYHFKGLHSQKILFHTLEHLCGTAYGCSYAPLLLLPFLVRKRKNTFQKDVHNRCLYYLFSTCTGSLFPIQILLLLLFKACQMLHNGSPFKTVDFTLQKLESLINFLICHEMHCVFK